MCVLGEIVPRENFNTKLVRLFNCKIRKILEDSDGAAHYTKIAVALRVSPNTARLYCQQLAAILEDLVEYQDGYLRIKEAEEQ